ncbi:MAG: menaquinone biosynthesis decarboxylase [Bacteroidetes bacterium CG23_combo_of_CG06-09_8_20_14_all_32_9]|nr:MAG: menaquinone biosynthesis decarboxylase [Bacteroidetes bacterium CG23_combo_of_CG06-09_8_20_14_all_32_9]
MPYNGLSEFVLALEAKEQLLRITGYVNPELEITEITDRISKSKSQNKALLFENTGTQFPLLINAFGSEDRICTALNIDNFSAVENDINSTIERLLLTPQNFKAELKTLRLLKKISSYFPKISKRHAPCQYVVYKKPDLAMLPILKCWPFDGGKFITLPIVNTKNPISGIRNAGMYRMQVFSATETGMHWHLHKTGAKHFSEYLKQKKKIPIAVILGGDPVYSYCASAPLPDGIDEYLLAGFLRKKRVNLVKCLTQDIEVPSDADFVIEGFVDPMQPLVNEGPFGDHTGFYSLPDNYPVFHVTCITRRKNAIYPATVVGVPPQEDFWFIKASERIFLPLLQKAGLPEVIDINMPCFGVAHNLVIVQIKNEYPGQAQKVAHSLWGMGQMMLNKVLVVTTKNPHNEEKVYQSILENIDFSQNLFFSDGPLDALEHATNQFAYGGKLLIDDTCNSASPKIFWTVNEQNIIYKHCKELNKVIEINSILLKYRIILLQIENSESFNPEIFIKNIYQNNFHLKCLILCDKGLNIYNKDIVLWHCLANIDPLRDIKKIIINTDKVLFIDGTSKPHLKKPWPNPVYSNKETISKINEIWVKLGFSEFEKSPSQAIHNLITNDGYEKQK